MSPEINTIPITSTTKSHDNNMFMFFKRDVYELKAGETQKFSFLIRTQKKDQKWNSFNLVCECERADVLAGDLTVPGKPWRTLEKPGKPWRTLEDPRGHWRTLDDPLLFKKKRRTRFWRKVQMNFK